MNLSKEQVTKLQDLELLMGRHRGRLAMALDLLTEAIVLSSPPSASSHTPSQLDLLNEAKEMIQNVLHELKGKK